MTNPYTNTPITQTSVIREFSSEVDPMELVWHQDEEDRTIEILEGEGWQLQRDNELPLVLQKGDIIFIPEYQVHRVIKGNTNLKIQITKQWQSKF
jgi:quercetin dioxygenase-like cupin family protein